MKQELRPPSPHIACGQEFFTYLEQSGGSEKLRRKYAFDYGIPEQLRIQEKQPTQIAEFFQGITTDQNIVRRAEPVMESYFKIMEAPNQEHEHIKTSEILVSKPQEITTRNPESQEEEPMYLHLILIKTEHGMSSFEMYTKESSFQKIRENTEHVDFIEPRLVEFSLRGPQHAYDDAHEEGKAIVRIIDPHHESIFQYKQQKNMENATNPEDTIEAARALKQLFNQPLTDTQYPLPISTSLEKYFNEDDIFPVRYEKNGFAYGEEQVIPHVDLGEGVATDMYSYRVKNQETGKVTHLVSTQSIYNAEIGGYDQAFIRPDTKCICHINPDVRCGCGIEFRVSLREAIKDNPKQLAMIALDTNGVRKNNGLIGMYEQFIAWKNEEDPSYEPEAAKQIKEAGLLYQDNRDFTNQVGILLTTAMQLDIPMLSIMAINGNKVQAFLDGVKGGMLENLPLPENTIQIIPDEVFYRKVQEHLPGNSKQARTHSETYPNYGRATRREAEGVIVQGRQAFITPFKQIFIAPQNSQKKISEEPVQEDRYLQLPQQFSMI